MDVVVVVIVNVVAVVMLVVAVIAPSNVMRLLTKYALNTTFAACPRELSWARRPRLAACMDLGGRGRSLVIVAVSSAASVVLSFFCFPLTSQEVDRRPNIKENNAQKNTPVKRNESTYTNGSRKDVRQRYFLTLLLKVKLNKSENR